ncbi:MAG: carbohydrate ABC transporter permease [Clostridia bacterium]|nr:carbohydrate ABC transporter permease [Clostridia bacterium]
METTAVKSPRQKKVHEYNRLTSASPLAQALIHCVFILFCAICVLPFIFVVIISFTADASLVEKGYSFFPSAWSLEGYANAFKAGRQLWVSLFNSCLVTVVGTVLATAMTALYSYAIYRREYKYRSFFTWLNFITMVFGGGLVPTIIVCKMLGMDNNYAALIVPALLNPFNVIIMRAFYQSSIPYDIVEAAYIDGCGEWRSFFDVVLPVAKPGVATIALLNMLMYWNDWQLAQIYIRNDSLMPLQRLLMRMQENASLILQNSGMPSVQIGAIPTENLRMALCVILVVPIACAYPFFQRYIVKGLTVGAVKG